MFIQITLLALIVAVIVLSSMVVKKSGNKKEIISLKNIINEKEKVIELLTEKHSSFEAEISKLNEDKTNLEIELANKNQ